MTVQWPAVEVGLEAVTVVCATLNLAFFWRRTFALAGETRSRRVAALVLSAISLGAMAEGAFVLASLAGDGSTVFGSLPWALVRAGTFAGTVGISALVLRRIADE